MKVESERSITVHITLQQEEASWLRDFLLKHSYDDEDCFDKRTLLCRLLENELEGR
jgi:hypothetical protein